MAQWPPSEFDRSFLTMVSVSTMASAVMRDRLQTIAADYKFASAMTVQCDANGSIHCETGPAVTPATGAPKYYWHGVEVPMFVVMAPATIKVSDIDIEDNAEVRRVMMERYGIGRYLQDCKAKKVAADTFGELYEKRFKEAKTWPRNAQRVRFVKVKNSSPEPDGTFKDYFLRVPPDVETPQEGIAWTFGLRAEEYAPARET